MARHSEHTSRASTQPGNAEERFRHLFDRYYQPITSFFAIRDFSAEECQDLTQETFLRVYRSLASFRGDAAIETWLFQIAANVWRNAVRSRSKAKRRATEVPLDNFIPEGDSAEDEVEEMQGESRSREPSITAEGHEPLREVLDEERVRLLREALGELPPQMQRCTLLRTGQGLKYREIAAAMGISINTVKSQLSQARERLRARLAEHFADIEL